jgi:uncharacterized membrane protein YfcA
VDFSFELFYKIILFTLGGAAAGVINTLAGNGTVITLPILVFLGLNPQTANGTNRVGVIMQGVVSFSSLRAQQSYPLRKYLILIIPCLLTATAGAYTASITDPKIFNKILAFVMVLMLYLVLQKPEKWLRDSYEVEWDMAKKIKLLLAFVLLGFYGGFIQAGMGVLMLITLVLLGDVPVKEANSVKALIIVLINIPAITVFIFQGQVHWLFGLLMGAGQSLGAWLTVKFLMNKPSAGIWVKRALIVMISLAIIKFAFF